jgi:hypothetical protein
MKNLLITGIMIGFFAMVLLVSSVQTTLNAVAQNRSNNANLVAANDHIAKAQTALQKGDIKGAQSELDLAKQSLSSGQRIVKPVNPDIP